MGIAGLFSPVDVYLQVRGAPAIGVVGTLSLVVDLRNRQFSSLEELVTYVTDQLNYLVS